MEELKRAKSYDDSVHPFIIRTIQNACCRAINEISKLRKQVKYLSDGK